MMLTNKVSTRRNIRPPPTVFTYVRIEATSRPPAQIDVTHRADRFVVCRGVRHVPIDLLPREVVTFRVVCGQDVVEDEHPCTDPVDCTWCRRMDQAWLLVKATQVI
jgi:hypothetical protein